MARILVVCGGQRNGSTSLLEGLEATGSLMNCGELFNPIGANYSKESYQLRLNPELNYYRFLKDQKRCCPSTAADQREHYERFIETLNAAAHARWIGLNIKFNSWHHFDSATHEIGRPATMVRLLGASRARFLLVTRDVAAQALSETLARESGAWHLATGQARSEFKRKVHVDLERLVRRAKLLIDQTNLLESWLAPHQPVVIPYEEVFDEDRFSARAVETLSSILQIPSRSLGQPLPLIRVAPTTYDWIENRLEVLQSLQSADIILSEETAAALSAA